MYEIFTGKQAIEDNSIDELILKHKSMQPMNVSEIIKTIDPVVEKTINRCLEQDPTRRPDTALKIAFSLPGGNPHRRSME